MMIRQLLGKTVFKSIGWTYEVAPDALSDPKQVIIGFPHTTNMDAVRAIALFNILQLPYHLLVKQELFKPQGKRTIKALPSRQINSRRMVLSIWPYHAQPQ